MKTTSKLVLALAFFCIGMAGVAVAAEAPPADTPPKMDNLDEGDPAVTNLKKANVKQTQQTIQNGEQTEVKVTNGIGTYIVKPNQGVGTSLPGDASSSSNHAAQWVIKSWGGSKNTEPADDAPPTLQPNPNAPPSSTPKK
ncbi:hypothetical protein [Solimicrobium silvestre]|nr:hypothetical protein [Solimicrobium silvestre]